VGAFSYKRKKNEDQTMWRRRTRTNQYKIGKSGEGAERQDDWEGAVRHAVCAEKMGK
jgi:hypothetical protein